MGTPNAVAPATLTDGPVGRSPEETTRRRQVTRRLAVAGALSVGAVAMYLFVGLQGPLAYALDLRSRQVGALVLVGAAVGVSSLVFQTIAGSRILTPGVMGFDSLFVLLQTLMIGIAGASAFQLLGVVERFLLTSAALTAFGVGLFRWLFRAHSRNLFVMVLVGIVLGTLFASLSTLISRLLSPDDFLTLQGALYASFTTVDVTLLGACAVVTVAAVALLWPLMSRLDIIDLGRDVAVSLGVNYPRTVTRVLLVVTVLVATSTALVGPMMFLGLLVANLARQVFPTHRHDLLVIGAALVGIATTVVGQFIVTHVLALGTPLAVVVGLVGGCYMLVLLMRKAAW